jgi:phenylalanyl-tRNA synthetase beta chain
MGYNASFNSSSINVETPAWRADILHDIDLVEDVAVGYGFNKFEKESPCDLTYGKTLPNYNLFMNFRQIMIGLGFNEVTTFTISNEDDNFKKLDLPKSIRVEIENPIGEEFSCLRTSLIPSLLKLLCENKHHPLPQQIFELGIIVDNNFKNQYNLGFLKIDAKANFTECKSLVEAIMRDSGFKYKLKEGNHPAFVKGRCAQIIFKDKEIGFFGEIHPKTIINFKLEHPIIAFEINADHLIC